jgi:hypothetical protein
MSNLYFAVLAGFVVAYLWVKKPDLPITKNAKLQYQVNPRMWRTYAWIITICGLLLFLMNFYSTLSKSI